MPKQSSSQFLSAHLVAALEQIRFERDELAYLTLTSKPEHAVRDRLAWALTKSGQLVAREWRRCDLAVFSGEKPVALVELKATNTGNVEWGRTGERGLRAAEYGATTYFEGLLRKDAAKARALLPHRPAFVLLVLYHVLDPVPRQLDAFVKYGHELRRVADKAKAERAIRSYLKRLGRVTPPIPLGAGKAFDIRVSVDGWLCGPV
jgi:hypothetical protein